MLAAAAAAFTGHNKAKNCEAQERGNEQQHDEQIEPERPSYIETGPHEPRQRNDEHHKADHQQRRLEKPLARRAVPSHP